MSFDLDAAVAEARGEGRTPFEFTFAGNHYTLPPEPDLPTLDALASGEPIDALRALLGETQYDSLVGGGGFTMTVFKQMLDAYLTHVKVESGESVASANSSEATAEQ